MTDIQRLAIERKAGMKIAREGIRLCQWRNVRAKASDPIGCETCSCFKTKSCEFRKFLDARGDKKAWVAE